MKIIEITAVGIRLSAIAFLVKMFWVMWSVYESSANYLSKPEYTILEKFGMASLYLVPILIAIIAVAYPVAFAKLIVPRTSVPAPVSDFDYKNIQIAGSVILGLYFMGEAIPIFVRDLLVLTLYEANFDKKSLITELARFVEMLLGLYLIVGAKGMVELIAKIRNAGT